MLGALRHDDQCDPSRFSRKARLILGKQTTRASLVPAASRASHSKSVGLTARPRWRSAWGPRCSHDLGGLKVCAAVGVEAIGDRSDPGTGDLSWATAPLATFPAEPAPTR